MPAALERHLVLMRHAKSAPAVDGGADAARPLTDRGHRQAAATSRWLADAGLGQLDLALVSPAVRTQQTWHDVATSVSARQEVTREDLYGTGAQGLVALLAELPPEVRSVIVVGHEPAMSGTAAALAQAEDPLRPRMLAGVVTATAVVLSVPVWTDLALGTCRIEAVGPV